MKRIEPSTHYDGDGGYPTVVDVDLSRRGFLGAAVVGAVGLGGAALLPDVAEAGRRHGRGKVVLHFRYRIPGCKHRVEKVVVQSHDRRLIAFMGRVKERAGVYASLRRVFAQYKCRDLHDVKRLDLLQRALGKGLALQYRSRTRRQVKAPVVTLIIGRVRQRPDVDGDIAMPSVPLLPIG